MSKYKYFKIKKCERLGYSLVPIRLKDIYQIMDWRNLQIDILRQKEFLTKENQTKYFNEVIKPSFSKMNPEQILFSYLHGDKCIGYGGFVHIQWEEKIAEVSFLVDNKRLDKKHLYEQDFMNYLKLLKKIAFVDLKFCKIFTETYSFREAHIATLEKLGFELVKVIKNGVAIKGKYFDLLIHEIICDR